MSNVAICHISVALNIICNSKRGCRNIQSFRQHKIKEVWTKLKNEFGFSDNQSKAFGKKLQK